jgi:hypothetical protein
MQLQTAPMRDQRSERETGRGDGGDGRGGLGAREEGRRRGRERSRDEREQEPSSPSVLNLYHGLSCDLLLPASFDLIVHEILGNIASAEGAVHAVNELRARRGLTNRRCTILPAAAGTLLVPTFALEPCLVERLLMFERTGCSVAEARTLHAVRNFPSDAFVATPQPLEWLDFNRDLPYLSHRVCAFRTRRAGRFDGLHMHLVVQVHAYSSTRIPSFLLAHCVRLTF